MSSLVHVYKKLKPAVVAIGLAAEVGDDLVNLQIVGSGFSVHPRGVIVTCRHVFEGFQRERDKDFGRRLAEMRSQPGEVVRWILPEIEALFFLEEEKMWKCIPVTIADVVFDDEVDVCVMQAAAEYFRPSGPVPYPSVRLGDSDTLKEGQEVAASGFPYGHELQVDVGSANPSLSVGVVSAILPTPTVIEAAPDRFKSFQMDLTLNRGNSGGPVFRPGDGHVVGIAKAIYVQSGQPVGISYAIPINQAKSLIGSMVESANGLRRRFGAS